MGAEDYALSLSGCVTASEPPRAGECAPCGRGPRCSRTFPRQDMSEGLLRRKRNLTISEAAELTGLSRKAMARRVERGSVRSVLRSGRRLIPRSELVRVGLVPAEGEGAFGLLTDSGAPEHVPAAHGLGDEQSVVALLVRELVDLLQRQAGELAQYKALTAEAESLRL